MKKLFTLISLCISLAAGAQFQFDIEGATETYVTGINDSTYICGYFVKSGVTSGFFFNGKDTIIINDSKLTGATYVVCGGLNNMGHVIGYWNSGNASANTPFRYNWKQGTVSNTYTIQNQGYTAIKVNDIDDNLTISGECVNGGSDRRFFSETTSGVTFVQHYSSGSTIMPTYGGAGHNGDLTTGYYISGIERFGFVFDKSNNSYTFDYLVYGGNRRSVPGGMNNQNHYVIDVGNGYRSYVCIDYQHAAQSLVPIVVNGATAVHALDLNNRDYTCGWYTDGNGNIHGYYDGILDIGFRPRPAYGDGWSFVNRSSDMWPADEYLTDFSHDPYNPAAVWRPLNSLHFTPSDYPNWQTFVKTFGESYCYTTDDNGVVQSRREAVEKWISMRTAWGGSCFGMSANAIVRFDERPIFENYSPALILADNLTAFGPTEYARLACNSIQLATEQSTTYKMLRETGTSDIPTVLQLLQNELADTSANSRHYVMIMNVTPVQENTAERPGAHAVVPYRLEKDTVTNNGDFWISVYDPNHPGDMERKIIVHKEPNSSSMVWNYQIEDNPIKVWGSDNGVFSGYIKLIWPYSAFLSPMEPVAGGLTQNKPTESRSVPGIYIAVNDSTEHLLVNSADDTTGFYNGFFRNHIANAFPFVPITGHPGMVRSYSMPGGDTYTATLKATRNGPVRTYMELDSANFLALWIDSCTAGSLTKTIYDDGLTYTNISGNTSKVTLKAVLEHNYYFEISNMVTAQNQSVKIVPINGNQLQVINNGGATHYTLAITAEGASTISNLNFDSVPLDANTTHVIELVSDSSSTSGVWIEVDNGQNGTNEDTLFLQDQTPPQLALSRYTDTLLPAGGTDTIGVRNTGGGNLGWSVTSSPSWVTINSGNSGSNSGRITFSYTANTGSPRSGYLIVSAQGAAGSPDSVLLYQEAYTGLSNTDEEGRLLLIYPNPAKDLLYVYAETVSASTQISLFDFSGRQVYGGYATGNRTAININELAAGTYLVKVVSDKTTVVKKFIKN